MTPRERRAGRRRQRPKAQRPRARTEPGFDIELLGRIAAIEVMLVEITSAGLAEQEEPFDAMLSALAVFLDRGAELESPGLRGPAEVLWRTVISDALTAIAARTLGVVIERAIEERDAGEGE